MNQENHYRYLEPKSYKKTRFFGIKGRNMTVWHLVATMQANQFTIQETAEGYGLPVPHCSRRIDKSVGLRPRFAGSRFARDLDLSIQAEQRAARIVNY